jgi:hypothetical protein
MHDRRSLAYAIAVRDVCGVGIPVPSDADGCRRMIPAEIDRAQKRPVRRDLERIDFDPGLVHREYASGTELRDALGTSVTLVRGIPVQDRLTLRIAEMADVTDRPQRNVTTH